MARKTTRKQVNIKMPESLLEALKAKAEAEDATFTDVIVRFCEQGLRMDNQNAHQTATVIDSSLNVIDSRIDSRIADLEARLELRLKQQIESALELELGEKVARTPVETPQDVVESPSPRALPTTLVEPADLPLSTSGADSLQPVNELVETEVGEGTEDRAPEIVSDTPPIPVAAEPQDMGQNKKARSLKSLRGKTRKRFFDELALAFLLAIPLKERKKVNNDLNYFAQLLRERLETGESFTYEIREGRKEKIVVGVIEGWIDAKGVVNQELLESLKNQVLHFSRCRDKNLVEQTLDRFLAEVRERLLALDQVSPPRQGGDNRIWT